MGSGFWEKRIASNRQQAMENKLFLASRKVTLFNLIGSCGAGKTEVIRRTHEILQGRLFIQAVAGSAAAELIWKGCGRWGFPPVRPGRGGKEGI